MAFAHAAETDELRRAEKWVDPTDKRPITAHGSRATYRTWAEEATGFPHAVIEEAMGLVKGLNQHFNLCYRLSYLLQYCLQPPNRFLYAPNLVGGFRGASFY